MKPVFKCDYCNFMGPEKEVEEHELHCSENYTRRSCHTCQHRRFVNLKQFHCKCGKEIPEGKIFEFCSEYERREKPFDFMDLFCGGL